MLNMTEKLYYTDANLLDFEATIIKFGKSDNLFYTVLDKTAFYPTSGGQLYDTGFINQIEIIDVIENEKGEIHHISQKPIGEKGDFVKGVVDKKRRLRHKQQHTAQHILSQVFIKLFNYETVSVHLGEEYGAIELNTDKITTPQLQQAEQYANEIIYDNLQIEILFLENEQASLLPLRKIPERKGKIRIIKIGSFDYSACGGTHCSSTAEVSLIKIIEFEKRKGKILVKFLSGIQAVDDYNNRFAVTDELSHTLTCNVNDLLEKYNKLQSENKSLKKDLANSQKEWLPLLAQRISDESDTINNIQYVFRDYSINDTHLAGQLANIVAEKINGVTIIFCQGKLIIATSRNSSFDASQIAKYFSSLTNLKGGGNKNMAQLGGASQTDLNNYKELLLKYLKDV